MNRGFTVVEVLITITIMAILLGLGTVGLRSALANSRDAERASDIATLARGLEGYYDNGNPHVYTYAQYPAAGYTSKGMYPGDNEFIHIMGWNWCNNAAVAPVFDQCFIAGGYAGDVFPGVTPAAMTPPGKSGPAFNSAWLQSDADMLTQVNNGNYLYVPLDANGNNCYGGATNGVTAECVAYELRYKQETTGAIIVVKSKHQ
jgi:prepilin-type N-terminal cleavage/methylation domain-containing protein